MIDTAVARYLESLGLIAFDEEGTDGDAFLASMPDQPDEAVLLTATGGVGLTPQSQEYSEPTLQILVRGNPHDTDGPHLRAVGIYEALAGLHRITLDPGDFALYVVRVTALQSWPASIGQDENERFTYTQNHAFHIFHPTVHRE